MKHYKQFIKNIPSTVVYAVEDSSIPNYNIDTLVKLTKRMASENDCNYAIIVVNESIIPLDKKVTYLQYAYPNTKFIASENLDETIASLKEEYKQLIPIQLSESVNVTKMSSMAKDGNYTGFKKYLPTNIRESNAKLLMNDVRKGLGYEIIKEQLTIQKDELREQYYKKEIFNVGDVVEYTGQIFEIINRGSNYVTVVDINGNTSRKWLQELKMSDQTLFTQAQFQDSDVLPTSEISFKGYTSSNLHNADGAAEAFAKTIANMQYADPVSVLNALKYTDQYLSMSKADILQGGKEDQQKLLDWSNAHLKAKYALDTMGEFVNHATYWHTYKDALDSAVVQVKIINGNAPLSGSSSIGESKMEDKVKIAKTIATLLETTIDANSPEELINKSLLNAKKLTKESLITVEKLLTLAESVGIDYDKTIIKATKNLTTEDIELAEARAEKYGRRYPNPIDNAWVASKNKVKSQSPVVDKTKSDNLSQLRPDDEQKLKAFDAMGKGATIDQKDAEEIENYSKTGNNTGDTTPRGSNQPEFTHVGANLTVDGDDTLSRMKSRKLMGVNESCNCKKCKDSNCDGVCCNELPDEELDKMIKGLSHDDFLHAYDEDELHVVDTETGEKIPEVNHVKEEILNEVLSKIERIKAKLRFSKNETRIAHSRMLALKKHSDNKTINHRARKMAVLLIKKKLLRGQDLANIPTTERERIERILETKKKLISRLAMKLVTKVRQFEKDRLSHKTFTK